MRAKMLTEVLKVLNQIEGLDKDFLKFLEVYLNDPRGENVRNEVAHGLANPEIFTERNVQILILILVKLASYKVELKTPT